ncbi:MAG TPA: hypothetical protein VGD72_01810 [Mycobacteriales bacterium]
MIPPAEVLAAVRTALRDEVLPHVGEDRARTALVAALGILGDVALQVREDDRWCADSASVLAAALGRCGVPGLGAPPGETPTAHRRRLLAAARRLLAGPPDTSCPDDLRGVRSALAHDLTLQQRRTRTTGGP